MKQTFGTALFLFVAWNLLATVLPVQQERPQNLWNGNVIAAEEVLFDVDSLHDKTVVLGSSYAAGLSFEENTINLSLAGLSVYDGQMILSKRCDVPKAVWVEANVVQRPPSDQFSRMFTALGKWKRFLPGLRTKNQPIAVSERFYEWARPRLKALILNRPVATVATEVNLPTEPDQVWRTDSKWGQPVDPEELRLAIKRLDRLVAGLTEKGVDVAFFEMPQHPSICDSLHAQSIRESIKTALPSVPYLDHPDCADYSTSDGIHLTRSSADKYQKYLQLKMQTMTGE